MNDDPTDFDAADLLDFLEKAESDVYESVRFGLIMMDRTGIVQAYNRFESQRAGISPDRVIGRNFFIDVGPCTNNYLVAERFHQQAELDEQLDYVFTFRMAPTPVRLRLLARAGSPRQYLAIRDR